MLDDPQGTEQLMEKELLPHGETADTSVIDEGEYVSNKGEYVSNKGEYVSNKGEYVSNKGEYVSNKGEYVSNKGEYVSNNTIELVNNRQSLNILGIIGCGAIANIITDFAVQGKLKANLKYFYDKDRDKADKLASRVDGIVVPNFEEMLNNVDLVIEAASPSAVIKYVPKALRKGKDVIIMSIGALIGRSFREKLEKMALINDCSIYTPSGAIIGLDGLKAASMGKIIDVSLITRKPPRALGVDTCQEVVLYEGKVHDAVFKFPKNMNVAAALSIVSDMDVDVKLIADPNVKNNCHEIKVTGDFGELRTTTQNTSCITNPKTSVLAAYSVIKLLNSLNENLKVGT